MKHLLERTKSKTAAVASAVVKRDLLLAIVVAVIVIIAGVFLAHQSDGIIPLNADPISHYHGEPNNRLSFFANWDAPDYINIAEHGYQNAANTNFFPLYPVLIRAVNTVIPSALYSALLIAWAGFVGAVYFYIKIAKQLFKITDNREALRALLPFILFPTGVFLFAPYTEGLFGLLALGAIYFALRKQYALAAVGCLLATAMHITGVFVLALVGLLLLEQGVKFSKAAAVVAAGSLGIIAYMIYLKLQFHSALAFVTAQKGHGWLHHSLSGYLAELGAINLLIMLALVAAAIYWWPRRKSFSVYALLFLCIPLIGGQFGGFNRYSLMAFPVPLMFYECLRKRPLGYAVMIAATSVLWAHYLFQYAAGYVGG